MKYRRRHKLAHRGIVPSGLDRERLGNGGDPIAMIQNLAISEFVTFEGRRCGFRRAIRPSRLSGAHFDHDR